MRHVASVVLAAVLFLSTALAILIVGAVTAATAFADVQAPDTVATAAAPAHSHTALPHHHSFDTRVLSGKRLGTVLSTLVFVPLVLQGRLQRMRDLYVPAASRRAPAGDAAAA